MSLQRWLTKAWLDMWFTSGASTTPASRATVRHVNETASGTAIDMVNGMNNGTAIAAPSGLIDAATGSLIPRIERRQAARNASDQSSLFGEILDWMFAPLLLIWPVSVALTFIAARDMADRPYDTALNARATLIAEQIQLQENRVSISPELMTAFSNPDAETLVQISDPAGQLIAGIPDLPKPKLYDFPEPGKLKLRNDEYKGDAVRIAYTYLYQGPQAEVPAALVQVLESQDNRAILANEIIKSVILPQFLILPIAGALVWFGLSRGLSPLKSVQRLIRARRPEDQSPIDPAGVPQEISPLVDSFNDLLLRLTASINSQKRFVADAAHQIKTPLAGLRTQAELALRHSNPDEVKASLEQVVKSTERAARLVNQLLSLARTDAQREPFPLAPIDLTALAKATTTEWVERALQKPADLGFESDASQALVRGDGLLLQELLANLIDNALRYTPSHSVVTVRVRSEGPHVYLEVEDNGPGIAASEQARVFDRFYRVLGTDREGSGLGLSIVKEIADQHSAPIELHPTHPGQKPLGLKVRLQFAKAPAF